MHACLLVQVCTGTTTHSLVSPGGADSHLIICLKLGLIRLFFHPEQCFSLTNSSSITPNHPNPSSRTPPNTRKRIPVRIYMHAHYHVLSDVNNRGPTYNLWVRQLCQFKSITRVVATLLNQCCFLFRLHSYYIGHYCLIGCVLHPFSLHVVLALF